MNERAVFELPKTIAAWDADYYHPIALPFYDRAVANMIEAMGAVAGDTVLDAGCGPGAHCIRAARLGLRVHAIDIADAMIQEARRRVENAGATGMVQFERQDLTRLSFADASFRHVFSWGVVIHIEQIDKALSELARIVQPEGTLALAVSNVRSIDYGLERFARGILRRPLAGVEHHAAGDGMAYAFHGQRLWLWRLNSRWLISAMEQRGFRLRHRLMGSLTEIHCRLSGRPRNALLRLNRLALWLGAPKSIAATNIFVFEKIGPKRDGAG
jgi:SAM-dependent methyltransferase